MDDRQLAFPWDRPVFVRSYLRVRFGREESVTSHYRSLPRR